MRDASVLVSLRKKAPNSYVRNCIDEAYQSVQNMDPDFQWMLCNAIDRMKKKVIKESKTTYKYSREHRERLFLAFQSEIAQGNKYYSEETRKLANKMMEEVALLSDTDAASSWYRSLQQNPAYISRSYQNQRLEEPDLDNMEGQSFESFCADLLRANGFYDVELTKVCGDQGVDVLAVKDDIKYAIQCKCYKSDVGNKPVQEVYAGKSIYRCHIGVVMTNSYFTPGAIDAAKATGVLLWDRRKIKELIEKAKAPNQ